jgi:hypothetical protein
MGAPRKPEDMLKEFSEFLAAKTAAEAESPEDFDVWLKNDKGQEATVPYSQAKQWLHEAFGIGEAPESEGGGDGGQADDGRKAGGSGRQPAQLRDYFKGTPRAAGGSGG